MIAAMMMNLSSLKAPHPVMPHLESGDKRVHAILRDLEKIKNSKPHKRIKRSEFLINYITQSLRKCTDDHLLHATSIWALITIFRLFPEATKEIMIAAGVPGCLFDILKSGTLSGSSRKYASELCFYLSSNYSHPGEAWDGGGGPMDLPTVQVANRYQPDLDDVTLLSDISSIIPDKNKSRAPFVPYRINEGNLAKMEALFEHGYHNQLAASLPNHLLLSKYGFQSNNDEDGNGSKKAKSKRKRKAALDNDSDSDSNSSQEGSDDDEDDDQQYADDDKSLVSNSTLSSASRSQSHSLLLPLTGRRRSSGGHHHHNYSMSGPSTARSQSSSYSVSNPVSARSSSLKQGVVFRELGGGGGGGHGHGHSNYRPGTTSLYPTSPFKLNQQVPAAPLQTSHSHHHHHHGQHDHRGHSQIQLSSSASGSGSVVSHPHRMIHHLRHHNSTNTLEVPPTVAKEEAGIFSAWTNPSPNAHHRQQTALANHSRYSQPSFSFSASLDDANSVNRVSTADIGGLDDFFSSLDPLTANTNNHIKPSQKKERMARAVDEEGHEMDEDMESWLYGSDDSEHTHTAAVANDEDEEDADAPPNSNAFITQRRLRMRAEKLIDHSFIQRLFIKHTPLAEGQALIRRLESLFELLDHDHTGYVTFEAFSRLILAVAPPRILRSDVLAFVNAQTSNMASDMVDYHEFVISGKVLLLTKGQFTQQRVSLAKSKCKKRVHIAHDSSMTIPTSTLSWLRRQKAVSGTGDQSTLTWKQHLLWYQRRKAQAIIWLIRRATRSLTHEIILIAAQRWLIVRAKQALAMNHLIALGHAALLTQAQGMVAKCRLCKRVMHARRFVLKVQSAQEYLQGMAHTAIRDLGYMDRVNALKSTNAISSLAAEQQLVISSKSKKDLFYSKKKAVQASYGNLFKVTALHKLSIIHLQSLAHKAIIHYNRQDKAVESLQAYSRKVVGQRINQDRACRNLKQRAEAAYTFCLQQDQALLNLLRMGNQALSHFDAQVSSLAWLMSRGQEAVSFLFNQSSTIQWLIKKGKQTLLYLNNREDAHFKLNTRRIRAVALIIRKKEAISYLRDKPRNIWKILDNTQTAQTWLVTRAIKAKTHYLRKLKAFQFLCFIAGSATSTGRKTHLAYNDLCQLGTAAKYITFKTHIVPKSGKLLKLVAAEKARNNKLDLNNRKTRETWSSWEERLKVELLEAFVALTSVYSPSHIMAKKPLKRLEALSSKKVRSTHHNEEEDKEDDSHEEGQVLMGQHAYRILTNQGKLLQVPLAAVDEQFRNTDINRACYLPFHSLYPWLKKRYLKLKQSSTNNSFEFRCSDLLSAEERAIMSIYLRVQRDSEFLATADEMNEYEEAKKRLLAKNKQLQDDSDEDEEEEEEVVDEGDEDMLFADLERLRNMDVGRLMRYLTRQREEKEYAKMMAAAAAAASAGVANGDQQQQQSQAIQEQKEKTLFDNDESPQSSAQLQAPQEVKQDESKEQQPTAGKELFADAKLAGQIQEVKPQPEAGDAPPPIAI